MFPFFAWIEATALSAWIRESPSLWAFPFILILHTVGMGFLVGTNVAVDLRVLGFGPRIPLPVLERFFFVMKFGFVVNALSGVLLLIGYPTKALTNPLFYVKLVLIAVGVIETGWIRSLVLRGPKVMSEPVSAKGKALAGSSLAVWAGAVGAGRFLAYTYNYLMAGE